MFGEKFIEKRIEGNKIIRVFEFKEVKYDYEQIAVYFNDYVTDDPEDLFNKGIYLDYDDFNSLDADLVLDWVHEKIEEEKRDNPEDYNIDELQSFIKPLEEAQGFTIHFKRDREFYYGKDKKKE